MLYFLVVIFVCIVIGGVVVVIILLVCFLGMDGKIVGLMVVCLMVFYILGLLYGRWFDSVSNLCVIFISVCLLFFVSF